MAVISQVDFRAFAGDPFVGDGRCGDGRSGTGSPAQKLSESAHYRFDSEIFAAVFPGSRKHRVFRARSERRHKGVAGLLRLGRDLGRFDMVADLHDVLRSKGLCRLMKLRGTRIERIDKGRAEKKMLTAPENKQRVQLKTTVERYREVFVRLGFDLPEIPLPSRIRYPMSEAVARLAGRA